jgi:hypothetical protein
LREIFFPYKRVRSEIFGEVLIPIAKAFLVGRKEIGVDVLVDSGAVISIFPESLCDLLGLTFEEGKRASVKTATGEEIPIRIHKIKMRIGDFSFDARIAFCEIENIPYVLGRLDIIDKIGIKFNKDGTSILIEE